LPVLAAIAALVALIKDCAIEIGRNRDDSPRSGNAAVAVGSAGGKCSGRRLLSARGAG